MSVFSSVRSRVDITVRLGLVAFTVLAVACGDDAVAPSTTAPTHVRVVNSLFQDNGSDTTAVAIDFLIDSATTAPSVFGLPAHDVSPGDSAGGFRTFVSGVHGFVARRAGDTTLSASIYTTSGDFPYVPRQSLIARMYYTIIAAGIVPATGAIPNNRIPFVALVDDAFPGPRLDNVTQARFRVINAAPYTAVTGAGAAVTVFVTPGSTPPASVTLYASLGTAAYRNASVYMNVDPGAYVVTLRAGTRIVAQQPVTFAAGEVRSLVLQSTASGTPNVVNHIITNLLDHQY